MHKASFLNDFCIDHPSDLAWVLGPAPVELDTLELGHVTAHSKLYN
jgi:hypothetical protein